jgi:hypothetical protein
MGGKEREKEGKRERGELAEGSKKTPSSIAERDPDGCGSLTHTVASTVTHIYCTAKTLKCFAHIFYY